ncbi:MAG TPA: GDSL-type esterase/lipase family protein [Ilumatobacter sp.]
MPNTSALRRRAPRALAPAAVLVLVPVAAVLLLAGCGLDGSDAGVQALVPSTSEAGDQAGGPNAEMAPEESVDAGSGEVELLGDLPDGPPAHLPQASLPPRAARPAELPETAAIVGDSLTESAQQEIAAYLNGLGVDVVTIDGAQNRRMTHGDRPDPGIDIVERIAAVAEPEVWVIALGTNDVGAEVSPEQFGNDVKTLLAAIPADAPVVWVDVWIRDRQRQVETANAVLREMLADRGDSVVADWYAHGDDPGIITGDGVHLTNDGRYMFAATIAAATADLFESV